MTTKRLIDLDYSRTRIADIPAAIDAMIEALRRYDAGNNTGDGYDIADEYDSYYPDDWTVVLRAETDDEVTVYSRSGREVAVDREGWAVDITTPETGLDDDDDDDGDDDDDEKRDESPLADAIRDLALALDPHRQGEQWPDPVSWDGRPLADQARDLLVQADARGGWWRGSVVHALQELLAADAAHALRAQLATEAD